MSLEFTIAIPDWLEDQLNNSPKLFLTREDRMQFVCALARENVQRKVGGPFGAGIFDQRGNVVAVGINLVEYSNCSLLHAEMVAIALAQRKLGRYDMSDDGKYEYELVSSTEPCAMCFGAIPWSGVKSLVCGARDEDARAIGFDEGPKLHNWQETLEERGIRVYRDVLRDEAVDVLKLYAHMGGVLYNAG